MCVGDAAVHPFGLRLDVFWSEQTVGHQLGREQLADGGVLSDLQVHQWLRVRRLVGLVVSEPPVADQVHHDVAAVFAAVVVRERHRRQTGLDVVGVDVDDGNVESLGEVGCVARRPPLQRIGGEADLVVGDEMHCAAGRVAGKRLQVEHLLHDSLPRKGCVAVDQHRKRRHGVEVQRRRATLGLRRAAPPLHHRVDRLEVAGVWQQPDQDHLAGFRVVGPGGADVVFHVAGRVDATDRPTRGCELERVEDRLVRVIGDVRDHREPSAVGHAHDDLADAVGGDQAHERLEHRHQGVETLE